VARARVDWRDDRSAGYKFNEWELKGVPLRLEIGPRDVAADQTVLVRRDTREKLTVPINALAATVEALLPAMQADLFAAAKRVLDSRTVVVDDYHDLATRVATNAGWSLAGWCGGATCEAKVKAETKATIRVLPFAQPERAGECVVCRAPAASQAVFARAY
jgi:prolyl-tRNA synthetase